MAKMTTTQNGGKQYEHSGSHAVEFFSKAGSLFTKRKQYYGGETSALVLFRNVWHSGDHEVAMKLLFWLRDIRSGAGNRSGFRECISWLCEEAPEWVIANVHLIPKYGRYDDLKSLYVSPQTGYIATNLWATEILSENILAAKWSNINKDKFLLSAIRRVNNIDNRYMLKDIGDIRRLISRIRKDVVEVAMSKKEYSDINYSHVPSVAMARYSKAFSSNDAERFSQYKESLKKAIETGDTSVKINAGAIFPHDVIRTLKNGDTQIADLQFTSLPNFMEESNFRVMTIADSSGSMGTIVSGEICAIDISIGLALYCSDRLGKDNPFYRKFMQFCDESKLTDWSDCENISHAMQKRLFNLAVGSTNIAKALNTILSYGTLFNATNEQMPNCLLIISDMQFDHGGINLDISSRTVVEQSLDLWEEAGYTKPIIVYWNTAGNAGAPSKNITENTCLISGFSPSILKAVFSNPEHMSPYNVMMEAIKNYEVVIPK